jgi:hypothetical protein
MVLARIRQIIACCMLAAAAGYFFLHYISVFPSHGPRHWLDPAVIFYPLALIGLSLRFFWARYLTICFAISMFSIKLVFGGPSNLELLPTAAGALFVLLLSGESMRRLFDERPGRFNSWVGVSAQVHRLRWLILAQSVALGLFWGLHFELGWMALGVVGLAATGLLGMVFQKTWGLALLGLATLGELGVTAFLGLELSRMPADYVTPQALPILGVLAALALISCVLMTPFWIRFAARLRGAP